MAVKALACELPSKLDLPLSRWFVPDLRAEAIASGIVAQISETTIWRWLSQLALSPRPRLRGQGRPGAGPVPPAVRGHPARGGGLRDLRRREDLDPGEVRVPPTLAPAASRAIRVEHEYARCGALQYLAAWDVHRAKLFGRCEEHTGIAPFGRLVGDVMAQEPYASARRVFWVVDNGPSHRGESSIVRLETSYPNLRLIHCPVHSSWLNQAEVYFSVLQRKVLTPNDFTDLDAVERRVLDFQARYEEAARPFQWKFTKEDLRRLMERLREKEERALVPAA